MASYLPCCKEPLSTGIYPRDAHEQAVARGRVSARGRLRDRCLALPHHVPPNSERRAAERPQGTYLVYEQRNGTRPGPWCSGGAVPLAVVAPCPPGLSSETLISLTSVLKMSKNTLLRKVEKTALRHAMHG